MGTQGTAKRNPRENAREMLFQGLISLNKVRSLTALHTITYLFLLDHEPFSPQTKIPVLFSLGVTTEATLSPSFNKKL